MKYWHIYFENDGYWMEVDEEGVVLRQIVSTLNGSTQLSCFEDCLAEGLFDPLDMDGDVSETTDMLFEERWQTETKKYYNNWKKQKSHYAIGQIIDGQILYYYPQGCIVKIGDAMGCVLGLDDNYNIGDEIQGIVRGYDEQNMWILISKVYENSAI